MPEHRFRSKPAAPRAATAFTGTPGRLQDDRPGGSVRQLTDRRSIPRQAASPAGMPQGPETVQRVKSLKNSSTGQKTTVKFKTQDYEYEAGKKEAVGNIIVAEISPSDPHTGSKPGPSQIQNTMDALKDEDYKGMVKGHLLNAQLGGVGAYYNLFPITSKANSEHKFEVENFIKEAIKGSFPVKYTVMATPLGQLGKNEIPSATFTCEAIRHNPTSPGGTDKFTKTVKSEPQKNSTGTGDTESNLDDDDWGSGRTVFATIGLPTGWGELGSGESKNRDWSYFEKVNTLKKISKANKPRSRTKRKRNTKNKKKKSKKGRK